MGNREGENECQRRCDRISNRNHPHRFLIPHPSSLIPSSFDALILATPSPVTAKLLQPIDAALAADLASITHSGTAILSLGYEAGQIGHPLDGMGAVVPADREEPHLGVQFQQPEVSRIGRRRERSCCGCSWAGRAGRNWPRWTTTELRPLVLDELSRLLRIRGEPCYCNIAHWPGTMPQYHVGHKELVARIEARVAALPNLALAGNAYHGVGIPDCIHGGELAAERVSSHVKNAPDSSRWGDILTAHCNRHWQTDVCPEHSEPMAHDVPRM